MKLGAESVLSISSTNTFTYKVAAHLGGPGQDFTTPGSRSSRHVKLAFLYYDLVQQLGFLMHKNHRCYEIPIHDPFSF